MNRKGFLKRIAGALGLLALGGKVVAKPSNRHTIHSRITKTFIDEFRKDDLRFSRFGGSQWGTDVINQKSDRPRLEINKITIKRSHKYGEAK